MTEQEANKQRLRELLAAVDAGDISRALEFYSPDYVDHDSSEARQAMGSHIESLQQAFSRFAQAFTGTRHSLDDVFAEGDRVAARISVVSRHTGAIFGFAPSGQVIRNDSLVIYRFSNGQICERWCRERRSTRCVLELASRGGPQAVDRSPDRGDL